MTALQDEDHDVHGTVVYLNPDGSVSSVDECCDCPQCDCVTCDGG